MAQQTNLNVSPYFDDFDPKQGYHKVLFKPGYPVQARELTGLQSILQNQIEKFGQHFFKEGARVIPGSTAYAPNYYAVEINNTHLGVPVNYYIDQLVGRKIIGLTTGVTAIIDKVLEAESSERGNLTIYVSYMSSGVEDSAIKVFDDGELLTADSDIVSGEQNNAFIPSGESFASCVANNATSTASSFSISNGVYFIRGNFVNVDDETIILDQYDNKPSARIGLRIEEDIINADEDPSLADNSKGFNNYAAPGADRLKITATLYAKPLDDFNDSNFVELAVIENGKLKSQKKHTSYNFIADELARRTYAESGDYTIKPFDVSVKNSLNDGLGNGGIYEEGTYTEGGALASEDMAVYQVGPGKAFVKGYEIETISPTFLNAPKPRTTKLLESQGVAYKTGKSLRLNKVKGHPVIGIGNTYIVSLRDTMGSQVSPFKMAGKEIGVARVYDHVLESGSYSASNGDTNEWDISIYDVQLTSHITLNESSTINIPAYVKGKYSGATGYVMSAVSNSTSMVVYEKKGEFLVQEPIIFETASTNAEGKPLTLTRIATAVTSYGMEDVKQLYSGPELGDTAVEGIGSFAANVKQEPFYTYGSARMTSSTGSGAVSISTITSEDPLFPGNLKIGNILSFGGLGNNEISYVGVTSIHTGHSQVIVTGIATVTGVVEGALYKGTAGTNLDVSNLKLVQTPLETSQETALYTLMPKSFISDVDLTDATLTIRKEYSVNITINGNTGSGQLSSPITLTDNKTFLPFDEERYALVGADGNTIALTDNMFQFSSGNTVLQIQMLGAAQTGCTLITTQTKSKPSAKIKRKNRVNAITVTASTSAQSGTGSTSLNDGLVYGSYPLGTRVQDKFISLNHGDVAEIHAVFESNNAAIPSAPTMVLTALNGPSAKTEDLIIGEMIVGADSGARAIVAEYKTDSKISFILKNTTPFTEGEIVNFKESSVQGIIRTLDNTSRNISANYKFTTGQKPTFYDYSFITRKDNARPPTKSLKIYFMNGYYESTDEGDITTKNSYDSWDYTREIPYLDGERVTDMIDIRPKVSNYSVVESSRSPFEFFGRSFTGEGNSAANILASDESIITNFKHYVGRIDRIFLDKTGRFQVQYGDPSEKREVPIAIDDAIEVASCDLKPYLFNVKNANLKFLKHKRYRMKDIKDLEDRIKNLEYYTSLSLLESETANMFVPDSDGMNQYKSGFFVDNFTSLEPQETSLPIKNSVDPSNKEVRPQHYTTSIDLMVGPVDNVDATTDVAFSEAEGSNIRKQSDIVTLDYEEVEWLSQQFATRTESVTPFLVSFWQATLEISPTSDTWVDTARIEAKIIKTEGNFAGVMAQAQAEWGVDPQTGLSPIHWNAWETSWTGTDFQDRTESRQSTSSVRGPENIIKAGWINGGDGPNHSQFTTTNYTTTETDTVRDTWKTGTSTRTGVRKIVTEQWDNESLGDKVVSRDVVTIMRSRNIKFDVTKCKPLTQMYGFFDGVNVTNYCTPKLMEITMESGTFQVGETVIGTMPGVGIQPEGTDQPFIKFRVAQANHRDGPYNAPTDFFNKNPYISQVGATGLETFLGTPGVVQVASASGDTTKMPSVYSATSTILNVDCKSLADQPQGDWFGYAHSGMTLRGQSSNAQAKISNMRLISDLGANLIGSFYIPNPNTGNHPKFETGVKSLTLIDNNTNDRDNSDTFGDANYSATGTLETVQESIISTRNATLQTKHHNEDKPAREFTGSAVIDSHSNTEITSSSVEDVWYDPLAQSFQVTEKGGIFITSCDIYFKTKDDMDIPMTFQIRTMQGGFPTQKILPFSEIVVPPDKINLSADGSVPTNIKFKAPVYLEGAGTEYSIALASWSTKYQVFISRIGESDILTDEFISQQPYLGSLFKSQNASTWEPSQWEDLKFKIYRAEFESQGTLEIYNPILTEGNGQVAKLQPNSLNINSRKIRIGIGQSLCDTVLTLGNVINQETFSDGDTTYAAASNASGNYIGFAGIATGSLGIVNAGLGYTPASGTYTFTGVGLTNITQGGDSMTASVTVTNGSVTAATVTSCSNGYEIGDVVGISTIGNGVAGRNARLSVVGLGQTNELVVDNVQGTFAVDGRLTYTHPISGITTSLNTRIGAAVTNARISQAKTIVTVSDGLHMSLDHRNHGMHHEQNRVTLSDVASDVTATRLSLPYNTNSSGSISVESSSDFETFEGIGVGATNPGLLQIGNEIIKYTGAGSGSISGITRGTDRNNYLKGAPVFKYEIGGVSLARINKTHRMDAVTDRDPNPITFDSYTLKIDQSGNTSGANSVYAIDRSSATSASFPVLHFNETKSTGGYNIHATQNIPFQIISPQIQNTTVPGTNVTAVMRTVSGSNLGDGMGQGTDIPFLDQGYEAVALNKSNYLNSNRTIASRINETNSTTIQNFAGDRSFGMTLTLATIDPYITPVIDLERMSAIFVSNRVDNPIKNYKTDGRVNDLFEDPHACQYVSKEMGLSNSASSIKLILNGHQNSFTDIRAFYAISNSANFDPIFVPFPGYKNIDNNGKVISLAESDGRSDKKVPFSDPSGFKANQLLYKEYTFTADSLPVFKHYRIKFILTSNSQTYVPRVSDLRVLTLA